MPHARRLTVLCVLAGAVTAHAQLIQSQQNEIVESVSRLLLANYVFPGEDWEGVGVQPEIPASSEEALETARLAALEGLGTRPTAPVVFAPGVVSVDGLSVYRGCFSPDGSAFYFFRRAAGEGESYRIHVTELLHGAWQPATPVDLGGDHSDLYPTLSPDGRFMVFSSYRPVPGTTTVRQANLWFTERGTDGWSEPRYLEGLSNPDAYNPGAVWGPDDILRYKEVTWRPGRRLHLAASWTGSSFGDPRPDEAFTWAGRIEGHYVWDVTLSPDRSIAILGVSRVDARGWRGQSDLWYARLRGGAWGAPKPIPGVNDAELSENFPVFTPDGEELLFVRDTAKYYKIPVSVLSP